MFLNGFLNILSYNGGDLIGRNAVSNVLDRAGRLPHVIRRSFSSSTTATLTLGIKHSLQSAVQENEFYFTHLLIRRRAPLLFLNDFLWKSLTRPGISKYDSLIMILLIIMIILEYDMD